MNYEDLERFSNINNEMVGKYKEIYFRKFLDNPPIIYAFGYNHPVYVYLMDKAINENKPITDEDLENIMDELGIKTDLIEE